MPYEDPLPEYTGYVPEIDLGRSINYKSPCYIIAEIGQNHQGDIMMAKKLIKLAKVSEIYVSICLYLVMYSSKNRWYTIKYTVYTLLIL